MPAPHPARGAFLKYLREGFPYKYDHHYEGMIYPYEDIKTAISEIRKINYELNEALFYFTKSRLPRTKIAESMHVDSTTYKRKLNKACDLVMEYIHHKDLLGKFSIETHEVKFEDIDNLDKKISVLESFLESIRPPKPEPVEEPEEVQPEAVEAVQDNQEDPEDLPWVE